MVPRQLRIKLIDGYIICVFEWEFNGFLGRQAVAVRFLVEIVNMCNFIIFLPILH